MFANAKYTCHKCYRFAAPSFSTVLRHIGAVHSWEPNFDVTCGINGCPRKYTSYRSYRKHILKVHSNFLDPDSDNDQDSSNVTVLGGNDTPDNDVTESDYVLSSELFEKSSQHSAALFILKAKEERKISQLME